MYYGEAKEVLYFLFRHCLSIVLERRNPQTDNLACISLFCNQKAHKPKGRTNHKKNCSYRKQRRTFICSWRERCARAARRSCSPGNSSGIHRQPYCFCVCFNFHGSYYERHHSRSMDHDKRRPPRQCTGHSRTG